jgi:hypothetical protein
MSAPQRPSQFTMFSNTTPHKHPSPLRRITARVRAHFDSSTESDITRRPRSHTHPEQYQRNRVLSEGQGPQPHPRNDLTYPRGFRRAAGTHAALYDRATQYTPHQLDEPGPHDLWMGGRAAPKFGLRTPKPLPAVGRRRYPIVPRSGRKSHVCFVLFARLIFVTIVSQQSKTKRSLSRSSSVESLSDTQPARIGRSVSATSSFVMLDSADGPSGAAPASLGQSSARGLSAPRTRLNAESEWVIRNGRRHLRTQIPRGVKQERKERKEAEAGGRINSIPYPVDYSPDTLARCV